MAPRFKTSTRVAIAVPALVLAGALAACSPPNQKSSDEPHGTSLPAYKEPAGAEKNQPSEESAAGAGATTTVTVTAPAGAQGEEAAAGGSATPGASTSAPAGASTAANQGGAAAPAAPAAPAQ